MVSARTEGKARKHMLCSRKSPKRAPKRFAFLSWVWGEEESFNDWGGRGCHKFVPGMAGDGTKIAPPGDIFDQSPDEMS